MVFKPLTAAGSRFSHHVHRFSQWSRCKHHHALIIGPPGGGKGTLSKRIVKNFGFEALSSGDMIRNQIQQKTEIGNKFASLVNDGKLVPSDVIMQLVATELEHREGTNWMLDGFPRAIDQAHMLQEKYPIDFVIHIDVPVDVIVGRLSARWCHLRSGRIYNTDYNPPKVRGVDDVTGEPLVQREDDKPTTVRNRLELYAEETSPLVQFYSEKGILKTFQGTESDVIYPMIHAYMEKSLGISPVTNASV